MKYSKIIKEDIANKSIYYLVCFCGILLLFGLYCLGYKGTNAYFGSEDDNLSGDISSLYEVRYNSNWPDESIKDKEKYDYYRVEHTILENNFSVPTGYYFDSWNTALDGSGTRYSVGDVMPLSADITLYAQWKLLSEKENDVENDDSDTSDDIVPPDDTTNEDDSGNDSDDIPDTGNGEGTDGDNTNPGGDNSSDENIPSEGDGSGSGDNLPPSDESTGSGESETPEDGNDNDTDSSAGNESEGSTGDGTGGMPSIGENTGGNGGSGTGGNSSGSNSGSSSGNSSSGSGGNSSSSNNTSSKNENNGNKDNTSSDKDSENDTKNESEDDEEEIIVQKTYEFIFMNGSLEHARTSCDALSDGTCKLPIPNENPVNSGYTFAGWSLEKGCNNESKFVDSIVVKESKIYYACFVDNDTNDKDSNVWIYVIVLWSMAIGIIFYLVYRFKNKESEN